MNVVIAILLGYAVLFYLLSREDFEVGATIFGLIEMIPLVELGVGLVNWVFGTGFSELVSVFIWLGLVAVWTVAAIWFLIDEPRKRRQREEELRRILNRDEY